MKVEELMIGDWVYITEHPMRKEAKQVKPEHFLRSLVTFEPIPLTPEILEKNGFEGIKEGRFPSLRNYHNDIIFQFEGIKEEGNCKILYIFKNILILYVHELQHALRLCKIEKEIVV